MSASEEDAREAATPSQGAVLTPGARLAAKKAAKAASKAAKKGTAPLVPGPVSERVTRTSEWIRSNLKLIWGSALAVILTTAVAISWSLYSAKTASGSALALGRAVNVASAPIRPEEGALESETVHETYPSQQARAREALRKYREVIKRYPASESAKWARLGEGNALFEQGQHEKAREAYTAALGTTHENGFIRSLALEGIGFTLEAEQKYTEAAEQFQKMATADRSFKPTAEYHLARMYTAQGDKKRAVSALNGALRALDNIVSSERGARYRFLTSEVNSRLRELGQPPQRKRSGSKTSRGRQPSKRSGSKRTGSGQGRRSVGSSAQGSE